MSQEQADTNSVEIVTANQPVTPSDTVQSDGDADERKPLRQRFTLFLHSTSASIYVSRFLSAWGDRMWAFAVGVYLADLSPDDLRLVASYGFALAAAGIFMGAIIGDIVDKYPRLKVARIGLACQNLLVALCAVLVCMVYLYKPYIYRERWKANVCEAAIIILSVLASLFSMAIKISVEKEWISVICEGDSARLARLSSAARGIDQFTNITAPALTGLLMSYGGMFVSAIFVAAWNVCSVFIEYSLLLRIYRKVPALASKKSKTTNEESEIAVEEKDEKEVKKKPKLEFMTSHNNNAYESSPPDIGIDDVEITPTEDNSQHDRKTAPPGSNSDVAKDGELASSQISKSKGSKERSSKSNKYITVLERIFSVFITLKTGWSVYFSYEVKYAGLGLAAVYMTVLGFDNITVAYAYSQGASQAILGAMMSLSALVGISATFAYPRIRKRIGIERTGLLGFVAEILCLCLCVVSVWAPGSPFDLSPVTSENSGSSENLLSNATTNLTQPHNVSVSLYNTTTTVSETQQGIDITSLSLLMAGMITARFGLWTLDLSISQLLLERVNRSQRGVVNGVQGSLNLLMDILKSVLVIVIPAQRLFGILICLSFLFVCFGCVSYTGYCSKTNTKIFTNCHKRSDQYDTG